MTVTMTIATLYMTVFWCSLAGTAYATTRSRVGLMKLCVGTAALTLIASTVSKPLTTVDVLCGLAITTLLCFLVVFIGYKANDKKSSKNATQ